MSDINTITVVFAVQDATHGDEVAASLRRVNDMCGKIIAASPKSWYGIGKAIADAEESTPGVTYAEVEFASYLAGLAVRE